jgi:NDP-sugar pyrophosphorylase family protein
MTKGIILSGGWGTRLRPLTCTIPKTLIPVVNKPVIERQMLLLKSAGVNEIVLAVSVMADALKNYFKDGEKLGLKIHYTNELHPMGTAGAIKLAEKYLKDDNFFMLNGDVILNFDFKEMLDFHKESKGIGTIASKIVEDPGRYGVLIVDNETNRIVEFQEKEKFIHSEAENLPMPINAGVYVLEPEVFSYISTNRKVSIERDIFPTLANQNKLLHFPISGIWKDIGKPEELLDGNILLMNDLIKRLNGKVKNLIDDSSELEGKVLIYPPVTIGENVLIRNNCSIGPNAIIGDNIYIDQNTEIKESIIYNETYISKNVKIEYAIISDNCHLHDNVVLKGNKDNLVILSSYINVLKSIKLIAPKNSPISICHHEIVKDSIE